MTKYWVLIVYTENLTSVIVISELLASASASRTFINKDCKVLVIDSNYARSTMLSLVIKTGTILPGIFETASGDVICFNTSTWWHLNPSL